MPFRTLAFAAGVVAAAAGCRSASVAGPAAAVRGQWVALGDGTRLDFSLAGAGSTLSGRGQIGQVGIDGFLLAFTAAGTVADSVVTLTLDGPHLGARRQTGRLRADGGVTDRAVSGPRFPTPRAVTWRRP